MRNFKYALLVIPFILFYLYKAQNNKYFVDAHSLNSKPPLPDVKAKPLQNEPPLISGHESLKNKTDDSSLQIKTPAQVDEQLIPWTEIDQKWMEALEDHLLGFSDEKGRRMFLTFKKEKEKFHKAAKLLIEQKTKISDKDFNQKFELAHNLLMKRTKEIFGKQYPEVKQFYKEYQISAQAYAREFPVCLDYAFAE